MKLTERQLRNIILEELKNVHEAGEELQMTSSQEVKGTAVDALAKKLKDILKGRGDIDTTKLAASLNKVKAGKDLTNIDYVEVGKAFVGLMKTEDDTAITSIATILKKTSEAPK
jgi:hypothetical protein